MWLVSNKLYYTALWVTILLYNRMTVVVVYHLGQILYNLNLFFTVLVADSCTYNKKTFNWENCFQERLR